MNLPPNFNPFDELGDMAEGEIALEAALAAAEDGPNAACWCPGPCPLHGLETA